LNIDPKGGVGLMQCDKRDAFIPILPLKPDRAATGVKQGT